MRLSNLSVLVKKYSLLHGTFGRAAPLFVVCRVREGQGKRPEGSRPFPSLEACRESFPGSPPASYSYLLDFSSKPPRHVVRPPRHAIRPPRHASKMYPVSTPELPVYTCLHAAQLNTLPSSPPRPRLHFSLASFLGLLFIRTFTMAYGGSSLALLIALSSCAFVAAAGDVASLRFESCGG